jgi:C1A family cysteine protease
LAILGVVGVVAVVAVYGTRTSSVTAMTDSDHAEFQAWMVKHGKDHKDDEYHFRLAVYLTNKAFIDQVNSENRSYKLELNQFSDLTDDEFDAMYATEESDIDFSEIENDEDFEDVHPDDNVGVTLPNDYNWVEKGAVTSVKNQGPCGSCYAFGTIAAIESSYYINYKKTKNLSEQQLTECSFIFGNLGCRGGHAYRSLKYAKTYGIENEGAYPYKFGENAP